MMTAGLSMLLVGAIAVHLEDARGLRAEDEGALVAEVARGVEAWTGRAPAIDPAPASGACGQLPSCLRDARARTGAEDVLLVSVGKVGPRLSLRLERRSLTGADPAPIRLDLTGHRTSWASALTDAAARLVPEKREVSTARAPQAALRPQAAVSLRALSPPAPVAPRAELVLPPERAVEAASKTRVGPWVALGVSTALAIAGTIFAVRTADALDQLPALPSTPTNALTLATTTDLSKQYKDGQTAVLQNGLAASLLLSAGAAGLVTSGLTLILD